MGSAETRTVRDPSTGETNQIESAEESARGEAKRPPPPLRVVVVDGLVRGELRWATEVWDLLERLGVPRKDAVRSTLRWKQLPDRIVIETPKGPRR